MTSRLLARARRLLCELHDHIRATLIAARAGQAAKFARIAGVTQADTIYHIDTISEAAIVAWFEAHWPKNWPVELVMEGVEEGEELTFPRGTPVARTQWKCILDPIDGTRGLMYDKRSAWILTGLAPQRGRTTHLGDVVVAVMTELPTSKQGRADQFSGIRGAGRAGLRASAWEVATGRSWKLPVQPSQAVNFEHGFASVAKFFPAGKALLATLEERLWTELLGAAEGSGASPLVFDDQYISTGGQMYELLVGHDRFIADLRPWAFGRLGIESALVCHPYDICTELILTEAGGIVETPEGKPLRTRLDTVSPVAWTGYANATLARQVRPVLRRLLREM